MKRRANGEGTIYEESDPRRKTKWRAEKDLTLPNGRMHRIIVRGRTQKEAFAKLDAKELALRRANPDAEKMTLGQYLDKWLEFKKPSVRTSTLKTYTRDVEHAKKAIGDRRLARVRPVDVQELLTSFQAKKQHAQADKVRRTLKQAFRQAVKWDLLAASPVDRLDPIRKPKPKRGSWTLAQAATFLRTVRESKRGRVYYPLFLAALNAGLRKGELIGLDWRHVTSNAIVVEQAFSRYAEGQIDDPKTEAGFRRIPVAAEVIAEFGPRGGLHDPVFHTREGTRHGERNLNRALSTYIALAGVPAIRLHDLRRTYATMLSVRGVPPRVVQYLLGHATPHLAMAVYQDAPDEAIEGAALGITPNIPPTGDLLN